MSFSDVETKFDCIVLGCCVCFLSYQTTKHLRYKYPANKVFVAGWNYCAPLGSMDTLPIDAGISMIS
jgi:hypothetical protein